jgi:hypothetical protein
LKPHLADNSGKINSYVNMTDLDLGTNLTENQDEIKAYCQSYYRNNVDQLIAIKGKYDPSNQFQYDQSIPLKLD